MRRFLDFLARRWDAIAAAKSAQHSARVRHHAWLMEVHGRQRERREHRSERESLQWDIARLAEQLRDREQENDAKQAKLDVLESQVEFAAAVNEYHRAVVDTELAKLAAERAAALRVTDNKQ
jgi:hypothetical protein